MSDFRIKIKVHGLPLRLRISRWARMSPGATIVIIFVGYISAVAVFMWIIS